LQDFSSLGDPLSRVLNNEHVDCLVLILHISKSPQQNIADGNSTAVSYLQSDLSKRDVKITANPLRAKSLPTVAICMEIRLKCQKESISLIPTSRLKIPPTRFECICLQNSKIQYCSDVLQYSIALYNCGKSALNNRIFRSPSCGELMNSRTPISGTA
jgi:hypothetical protein